MELIIAWFVVIVAYVFGAPLIAKWIFNEDQYWLSFFGYHALSLMGAGAIVTIVSIIWAINYLAIYYR